MIATPHKPMLKTFSRVFRYTKCEHSWVTLEMDPYDHTQRSRLPRNTVWIRPNPCGGFPEIIQESDNITIYVPTLNQSTFSAFQTALYLLHSVQRYRDVSWAVVTPFGNPGSSTAYQMRDAYVDFVNRTTHVSNL